MKILLVFLFWFVFGKVFLFVLQQYQGEREEKLNRETRMYRGRGL